MKENDKDDPFIDFSYNNRETINNDVDPNSNSNKENISYEFLYNNDDENDDNFKDFNSNKKTLNPKSILSKTIIDKGHQINNNYYSFNQKSFEQNQPLFKKRITEFLIKKVENKKKRKKDEKNMEKDLINALYDGEEEEESEEFEENNEENNLYHDINSNDYQEKFKHIVPLLMKAKRENERNEYMKEYKKRVQERQTLRFKLKNIFHIDSDFVVIWKTTLRIFHIVILFVFLLKYIFLTVSKSDSSLIIPKRIIILYNLVNFMFIIDLIISVLILIFSGGSKLTYFKLPLKIYTCIPFELKKQNFYFLLPKFIRIDIFQKIFSSWESYINLQTEFLIHNYNMKLFISCLIKIGKYLLIFGLYAHINSCILSYFDDLSYPSSLFYTIEAFTVVGFGEQSPSNIKSIFLVILNLFVGVNLFSLMTSNIKELLNRINSFYRETSYFDYLENMTFQIQKSTGRILPSKVKELMISYHLFRKGLSSHDIKEEFKDVLNNCKYSLIDKIREQLFNFLKLEFHNFFVKGQDEDFMYDIFENLRPKIFKENQVLIKSGEKVNKLYFLLNGQIYATDYNNKPIFAMMDNSIFGDYEFITNTLSCFNIKVHPKMPAYGFVLDRNSWEKISTNHVISSNCFIKQAIKKRKKHIQWMNKKYMQLFDPIPEIKEEESSIFNFNKEIDSKFDNININDLKIKKNFIEDKGKRLRKMTSKTSVLEKNPKYNFSNIDIIKNIYELQAKINQLEINFIENKRDIIDNLKENYL